ncbi:hypothetical protein [Corynebacterium sp. CCM 9204]|uniref:hypothetical protein n=1 Tax=Corynebacterium sp. CCM 9204 TaxID=3057616 RepID=UPI003524B622
MTADGRSSTDVATDWALAAIGDITGQALPGLGLASIGTISAAIPAFDSGAMSLIGRL